MTADAKVGDTVVATFRPMWENKGGHPYTVTDRVWVDNWRNNGKLMVGSTPLAGAVSVDVVEQASALPPPPPPPPPYGEMFG